MPHFCWGFIPSNGSLSYHPFMHFPSLCHISTANKRPTFKSLYISTIILIYFRSFPILHYKNTIKSNHKIYKKKLFMVDHLSYRVLSNIFTLIVSPRIPVWTVNEHCLVVRILSMTTHRISILLFLDWWTRQWSKFIFLKSRGRQEGNSDAIRSLQSS